MFEDPVWSTRGVFKTDYNTSKAATYLSDIKSRGFGISQLELDDGYGGGNVSYGDLSMVIDTNSLGSDVTLTAWVHPFVNPTAKMFSKKVDRDYFLPGKSKIEGDSVSLVKWWRDYGAVVNFLDDSVAEKHKEALGKFHE